MYNTIIFVGRLFRSNTALNAYAIRSVMQGLESVQSIRYFDENDKAIFLALEEEFHRATKVVIITAPKSFSIVGKLLCTLTGDSQVVKDQMLLPSKTEIYTSDSYLLYVESVAVNVMALHAVGVMPELLLERQAPQGVIHIFEESIEDIQVLIEPLAQTYDVTYAVVEFIHGWTHIEISAQKYGEIKNFIAAVKALFAHKTIAANNIMTYIIDRLNNHEKKISVAESCTGGLIATLLTQQSGASNVFDGSIVSYSNKLKTSWLGVNEELFESFGAVSSEVVLSMSKEICHVAEAHYGLAISGIAGPTGAVEGKPVGTVYVGVKTPTAHKSYRLQLKGDRQYIQYQSAYHAIKVLLLNDKALFF